MSTIVDSLTVQADIRPVATVRVVVHTTGPAGPTISDNHWSIYLIFPNNASSMRINMRAEYGDPTGILEWSTQNYAMTNSAIKTWDFPVAQGVKVAHIAQLIYGLGRQRYDMSGGGSGCRYWIWVIMEDLAKKGYINNNAGNVLWPDLLFRYHKTNPRIQLHMVQGTFYQ